jgi:hypothetical protein
MTKASLIALTAFVWTAAFAATGTLAHVVDHSLPTPPQITTTHLNAAIVQAAPPKPQPPPPPPASEHVITLRTVEIVASPPAPKPVHVEQPSPSPPRRLHCHEWRTLDQGLNAVQLCD